MEHVHLIGIGGSGLSAIARLLLESGYEVSGSDQAMSAWAQDLVEHGVRVIIGHSADNIAGADLIVRSSAIPESNVEIQAALQAGIPIYKRDQFLGKLLERYEGIAVAGTHGKTTTTAMIAWILTGLNADPSYIIGGTSKDLGNNAHAGKSSLFVIEADEYDRMFLGLHPKLAVITNIEHDHPDCYPTPQSYLQAFASFAAGIRENGSVLINADDAAAVQLGKELSRRMLTFGLHSGADYLAEGLTVNKQGGITFHAVYRAETEEEESLAWVKLQVPGEHNVRNALAALAVVHQLGLSCADAAPILGSFSGTGRRFDILGEANGVTVIDDYAHHPTEIKATLEAARSRYPQRRIWAVWQPHTFSRTQTLMDEFCGAFENADQVIVTEIYASREKSSGFSSRAVVEKMSNPNAVYVPSLEDASRWVIERIQPGDVLLVLSAGDATRVSAEVLKAMKEKQV